MKNHQQIRTIKYSLWAKVLFYPIYSLWIGWLYILGGDVTINFNGGKEVWRLI